MNERTSRSRDGATLEACWHDSRPDPRRDRPDHERDGDRVSGADSSRRTGHDPIPGTIDVDGVPMAVDRCRQCGVVVLDPGRPGGPCPGPNHTLTDFGVTPPSDREQATEPPVGRLALGTHQGETNHRPVPDRRDGTASGEGTASSEETVTSEGIRGLLASR